MHKSTKSYTLVILILSTAFLLLSCWDDAGSNSKESSNTAPKWTKEIYQDSCKRGDTLLIDFSSLAVDNEDDSLIITKEDSTSPGSLVDGFYTLAALLDTTSFDTVVFIVSDGELSDKATLIVKYFGAIDTNSKPTWSDSTYSYTATKGVEFTLDLSALASDIDSGTILSYKILGTTTAGIDTIVGTNYLLNAQNNTLTPYVVNIEVSDVELKDTATFTFTLLNANIPPVFTVNKPMELYEIEEGDSIVITVEATDSDNGDVVTLGIDTTGTLPNPETATFIGGIFNWKSAVGESGSYVVTFFATDGKDTTKFNATIKVGEANIIPTITVDAKYAAGTATVKENDTLTVSFTFDDLDVADNLAMSDYLPVVPGLSFTYAVDSLTATLKYTPDYNTVINDSTKGLDSIVVKVNDGEDSASFKLHITVKNVNRLPVFADNTPEDLYTVIAGDTLVIPFYAMDADSEDNVIITVDSGSLKTEADIAISENEIVWNTLFVDVGTDTISLQASDGENVVLKDIIVIINEDSTSPTITVTASKDTLVLTETDSVSFLVSATPVVAGDIVNISCISSLPDSIASFNASSGKFSFRANYDMASIIQPEILYAIKFTAKESGNNNNTGEYVQYIKVMNTNRAPTFVVVPRDTSVMINKSYSTALEILDLDGDDINVKFSSSPELPFKLNYNSDNNSITAFLDGSLVTSGDSYTITTLATDEKDTITVVWFIRIKNRTWEYKRTVNFLENIVAKDSNQIFIQINDTANNSGFIYSAINGGSSMAKSPFYTIDLFKDALIRTNIKNIELYNDSLFITRCTFKGVQGGMGYPSYTNEFIGVNISSGEDTTFFSTSTGKLFSYITKLGDKYLAYFPFSPLSMSSVPLYVYKNGIKEFTVDSTSSLHFSMFDNGNFECAWLLTASKGIYRKINGTGTWNNVNTSSYDSIFVCKNDSSVIYLKDTGDNLFKSTEALAASSIQIVPVGSINNIKSIHMINENVGWLLDLSGAIHFTNDGFSNTTQEDLSSKIISIIAASEDGHLFAIGENGEIFRY